MSSCWSQSGSGDYCGTCASAAGDGGSGEIILFGVRVKVDPMRKCVSMNNLSQYELPHMLSNADVAPTPADAAAGAGGYASADDAVPHQFSGSRERKRGVPWTEEEHKLFLLGLQKVGKGDWRGISRNFVKTRTPTQVASHAQKYFLRRSNLKRRRRRSSLFDITTDSVTAIPMQDEQGHQDNTTQLHPSETSNVSGFPVATFPVVVNSVLLPVQTENPMENLPLGQGDERKYASTMPVPPIAIFPVPASEMVDLDLNQKSMVEPLPLSLNLSLSFDHNQSSSRHSAFGVVSSFNKGDNIISVA